MGIVLGFKGRDLVDVVGLDALELGFRWVIVMGVIG